MKYPTLVFPTGVGVADVFSAAAADGDTPLSNHAWRPGDGGGGRRAAAALKGSGSKLNEDTTPYSSSSSYSLQQPLRGRGTRLRSRQHSKVGRGRAVHGEGGGFKEDNQQLILRGHTLIDQQLVTASHDVAGFNQSIASTFEKSVMEQARRNDLKELEICLTVKKLQLKQSQLALYSDANLLEATKINMCISKASLKEEKLRNRMRESRREELAAKWTNLLLVGMLIMLVSLWYGAHTFSSQRVRDETSSCNHIPIDGGPWWFIHPVDYSISVWHRLSCYVQVLSRKLFALLMILFVTFSLYFRRSKTASMPLTSILAMLCCGSGTAGKFSVDSLGGNGYHWLFLWEAQCLVHCFAYFFPSALHTFLYGAPVISSSLSTTSQGPNTTNKARIVPYWLRRFIFYTIMLLVLPTMSGMLPFASTQDWKDHFIQKIVGVE